MCTGEPQVGPGGDDTRVGAGLHGRLGSECSVAGAAGRVSCNRGRHPVGGAGICAVWSGTAAAGRGDRRSLRAAAHLCVGCSVVRAGLSGMRGIVLAGATGCGTRCAGGRGSAADTAGTIDIVRVVYGRGAGPGDRYLVSVDECVRGGGSGDGRMAAASVVVEADFPAKSAARRGGAAAGAAHSGEQGW